MKYVLGLYVPLTLGFLFRNTKDVSPELLLKAVKSGIRSGIWLSTHLNARNAQSFVWQLTLLT